MQPDSARSRSAAPTKDCSAPEPHVRSTVDSEYEALTQQAGLADRSQVGRLRVTGVDTMDLLDRLSTNELSSLESGEGALTILTSNKGRIVDLLLVVRQGEGALVLTSVGTRQKVVDWIDFYTIIEDVVVQDVTEETTMLSLAGPRSALMLAQALDADIAEMSLYDAIDLDRGGHSLSVIRTDFAGTAGYDVIVGVSGTQWAREAFLHAGATPAGEAALETVRVEQGVPAYGREMSEDYNPLEAGLEELISFTKGCYVGQEVVARLQTYQKVKKSVVGLRFEADELPGPSARLMLDGQQVGVVTSSVRSPMVEAEIGLGYVKKAHAAPGTALEVELGTRLAAAQVVELPFSQTSRP